MSSSKWIIEKLDVKQHQREGFDCGVEILNVYLKTRANQEQNKRLNVTYVLVDKHAQPPKQILGYYTLSNGALALYLMQPTFKHRVPSTYDIPTVKLGRLAADKNLHGNGVGRFMLHDACHRILEMSSISGIKGLEVIAKDMQAVRFYESFGFEHLKDNPHLLFLPIETILAAP